MLVLECGVASLNITHTPGNSIWGAFETSKTAQDPPWERCHPNSKSADSNCSESFGPAPKHTKKSQRSNFLTPETVKQTVRLRSIFLRSSLCSRSTSFRAWAKASSAAFKSFSKSFRTDSQTASQWCQAIPWRHKETQRDTERHWETLRSGPFWALQSVQRFLNAELQEASYRLL